MVTCKVDSAVVPKMGRNRKTSSTSSGFRLLDNDQLDNVSSVSRNSIYKIKIDAMFDDTRSIKSSHHHNRFDDRRGSHRTRSIIMYGKSELSGTSLITGDNMKNGNNSSSHNNSNDNHDDDNDGINKNISSRSLKRRTNLVRNNSTSSDVITINGERVKQDVQRISNSVQAQIERMFTDVAKDATCSFDVRCLGSLPLKDKVTSLQGLQDPLRQLYLSDAIQGNQPNGQLDICASGLRFRQDDDKESKMTPFHNIAVWSAVKFVVSQEEGGAAFLPLITDPENIDKSSLFQPLSASDQRRLSSGLHAPIFAVVMRSSGIPKLLECHAFVCQTPEDAIVIAATLYQSLMSHVSTNSHRSSKKRTPRNQNGVSCISIASSSAANGSNYLSRNGNVSLANVGRKNSLRRSNRLRSNQMNRTESINSLAGSTRQSQNRKKRAASSSLSGESDNFQGVVETTTEERKKKSHKTKRAPPIPTPARNKPINLLTNNTNNIDNKNSIALNSGNYTDGIDSIVDLNSSTTNSNGKKKVESKKNKKSTTNSEQHYHRNSEGGDILTRVAIPRSGSFLNTGGLTRYKSRATRRNSGKNDVWGGGGGLQENLHSLDDILNAIIDADGMSFNDLKPIYKEFLLKLAVTLTKDELYQRSKNIMRRQRKRKLKRKNSQKKKNFSIGSGIRNVFRFGKFRTTNKSLKSTDFSSKSTTNKTVSKDSSRVKENPCCKMGATSSSDVSVARHDNNINGFHRNSSSGYVSCSECSYDSEACTCESADRCYCSLGADNELLDSSESNRHQNGTMKTVNRHNTQFNEKLRRRSRTPGPRDSLLSCRTDDKCYCSMLDTTPGYTSDTTYCDTDSCNSASKCYCPHNELKQKRRLECCNNDDSLIEITKNNKKSTRRKPPEKFGLDYELFQIDDDNSDVKQRKSRSRSIGSINRSSSCHESCCEVEIRKQKLKQHEALSMKKSVEAAAIFADVKLSQTTDLQKNKKSRGQTNKIHQNQQNTLTSNGIRQNLLSEQVNRNNKKNSFVTKKHDDLKNCERYNRSISSSYKPSTNSISSRKVSSSSSHRSQHHHQRSSSTDNFLTKLNAIEKYNHRSTSKNSGKGRTINESYYQSMRIVSASLEDSLGYLP
ncbi:uncharacterized protein LOC129613014 isoform X2 [Condylostylus longicornis]|uniref:uncharacterized protein LOC129613014 isoform X2 n=1 Tax=Condylostylus longicornis TaxID=2530218 RepID=UPI00244E51D6|nr:uncharacterized protein LOC129613014 isoform X2 [Condylostylus longicornis]